MLFDIGIAGPIAGFVVLVPALFWGMRAVARGARCRRHRQRLVARRAAALQAGVTWLVCGHDPGRLLVNMHPMAFAAWFGLLATALNLFPFGQLDGGHISYAMLGAASTLISIVTVARRVGDVLRLASAGW